MGEDQPKISPDSPAAHLVHHMWRRGQSGNPNGRPKGTGITDRLREIVHHENGAEKLAEIARERAEKGDFRFWQAVIERVEGKVPDRVHQINANMDADANNEQTDKLLDDLSGMCGEDV